MKGRRTPTMPQSLVSGSLPNAGFARNPVACSRESKNRKQPRTRTSTRTSTIIAFRKSNATTAAARMPRFSRFPSGMADYITYAKRNNSKSRWRAPGLTANVLRSEADATLWSAAAKPRRGADAALVSPRPLSASPEHLRAARKCLAQRLYFPVENTASWRCHALRNTSR